MPRRDAGCEGQRLWIISVDQQRADEITATPPSRVRPQGRPLRVQVHEQAPGDEILPLTASHREHRRSPNLSRRHEMRHDRPRRAVDAALQGQRDHAIGAKPAGRRLVLQDARRRIVGEGHARGGTRRAAGGDDDGCRPWRRPFTNGGVLNGARLGLAASSHANASPSSAGSENAGPRSSRPIGRPSAVNPAGMEIAGSPVVALS